MIAIAILCGSETQVASKNYLSQVPEKRFLRYVMGCSRNERIGTETRRVLKIFSVNSRIEEHRTRWKTRFDKIQQDRLPDRFFIMQQKGKGIWKDLVRDGLTFHLTFKTRRTLPKLLEKTVIAKMFKFFKHVVFSFVLKFLGDISFICVLSINMTFCIEVLKYLAQKIKFVKK